MPDGDRYHTRIPLRFQKTYKVICEGREPVEVTEQLLLRALKKEIQKRGDLLVGHIIHLAEVMAQRLYDAGFDVTTGCSLASRAVDELRYRSSLPPRMADLVCDAAKGYLHDIRYNRGGSAIIDGEGLLKRVFHRLYRCDFEEPVEAKLDHYGGADSGAVSAQLQELRPAVDRTLTMWAHKAVETRSLARLRMPNGVRMATVTLDENLL